MKNDITISAGCYLTSVVLTAFFILVLSLGYNSDAEASPFQSDSNSTAANMALHSKSAVHIQNLINDWRGKLQELKIKHEADPAIAFKFIAAVTAQHDYKDYPAASEYYLYTLKTATWKDDPEAIKNEAERMMPLLTPAEQDEWKKEIKLKSPAILHQMVTFWQHQDPLLSTKQNERLLEHWQRIAYAQKHYNMAHNTVYHTDDRGLIYVKYGKPQQKIDETILTPNEITNPLTGGPAIINGRPISPKIPLVMNVKLWVYQFSNRGDPSYYLFGRGAHGGRFGLQPGILQMIPTFGYSDPMAGLTRLGGALMIKYAVVENLIGTTGYFSDLFNEMTSALISSGMGRGDGISVFQSPSVLIRFEDKEAEEARKRDRESPPSVTGMVTGQNLLPVWQKVYRFENNKGQTEYFLALIPDIPKFKNAIKQRDKKRIVPTLMKVQSSLVSYDKLGRRKQNDSLSYFLRSMNERIPFIYDFVPDSMGKSLLAGIDIVDYENEDKDVMDPNGKFSSLIGSSGPMQISLPDTLSNKVPEMSDIMMKGLNTIDWSNVMGKTRHIASGRLPFVPTIYPAYYKNTQALVYFEVYNLPSHHYQVQYRFDRYPSQPDLYTKPYPYTEKAAVTVNYVNQDSTDKRSLDVDLNQLTPGWYDLVMTLNPDSISGHSVQRRARFYITDKEKK